MQAGFNCCFVSLKLNISTQNHIKHNYECFMSNLHRQNRNHHVHQVQPYQEQLKLQLMMMMMQWKLHQMMHQPEEVEKNMNVRISNILYKHT